MRRCAILGDGAAVMAALERGTVALEGDDILIFTGTEVLVVEHEVPADPELTVLADMEVQNLMDPLHGYNLREDYVYTTANRAARRAGKASRRSWEKKRKKGGWS